MLNEMGCAILGHCLVEKYDTLWSRTNNVIEGVHFKLDKHNNKSNFSFIYELYETK